MSWYIAIGSMHGDDETSSMKFQVDSVDAAITAFKCEMREEVGLEGEGPDFDDGAVYIDVIYCCGEHEPMEVA